MALHREHQALASWHESSGWRAALARSAALARCARLLAAHINAAARNARA